MDCDFGDAIASTPQSQNRLENREVKMIICPEEGGKQ